MTRIVTVTGLVLALTIIDARAASFTCGVTMCRLVGFSQADCKKRGLPLALNWSKLPRVSQPIPGAVVVQRRKGRALGGGAGGHVSRVVSVTGPCRAIVQDNRGRYERNVCRNLVAYVSPNGMWTE